MRIKSFVLTAAAFLLAATALPAQSNGIFVDEPKVYDDVALQAMLNSLRASLIRLQPIDNATLLQHIGQVQGADVRQSQFALQAGYNLQPPQTSTTTSSGTPATQTSLQTTVTPSAGGMGNAGSTSPTPPTLTSTTQTSNTPTTVSSQVTSTPPASPMPAVPGDSNVSLPSTFGTSALDTLNEQMQVSYQIANLSLLLQGSLSDRFIRGTRQLKRHSTIGFPISINTPAGDEYKNAVAEVEVTVANSDGARSDEPPSVTQLLPRENTYNVASITDKSVGLGGGLVAGVFTGGASFFWSHKTYFLVKAQDTIAQQRVADVFAQPLAGAAADQMGEAGEGRLYYWVIATYSAGNRSLFGPVIANYTLDPAQFSKEKYVRLRWRAVPDAASYQVLRTSTRELPDNCRDCQVSRELKDPAFDDRMPAGFASSFVPLKAKTFVWQFKPVLGQKKVQPGLRQTFVQLAFPSEKYSSACNGRVLIRTRWLAYEPKTSSTGDVIPGSEGGPVYYEMPNFDLRPQVRGLKYEVLGGGLIRVIVDGEFIDGTHVRIGNAALSDGTPALFQIMQTGLQFVAPAAQIAAIGAVLVGRDGYELRLIDPDSPGKEILTDMSSCTPRAPEPAKVAGPPGGFLFASAPEGATITVDGNPDLGCATPCRLPVPKGSHNYTAALTGYETATGGFTAPDDQLVNIQFRLRALKIGSVQISPFNETNDEVIVNMDLVPDGLSPASNPLVALVGNKLFGLSDSPFELRQAKDGKWSLRFLAPASLLAASHTIKVQRLFWGDPYTDSQDIKEPLDARADSEFAISKVNLLLQGVTPPGPPPAEASPTTGKGAAKKPAGDKPDAADSALTTFAITGSHLDGVQVVVPAGVAATDISPAGDTHPTVKLITMTGAQLKGVKQIVLRKQDGNVVILPLPDGTAPKAKPAVDDSASVPPGARQVTFKGTALDQVASVRFEHLRDALTFHLSPDKKTITVDLPPVATAAEGAVILDVTYTDGSTSRSEVDVSSKKE